MLKTKDWTKTIKSSLTNIRRDGKNYLMNVGDNDIIIAVDDLDLGYESHREYLRQLIDLKTLHDNRFEEYAVEKVKIVGVWHEGTCSELSSRSARKPHPPTNYSTGPSNSKSHNSQNNLCQPSSAPTSTTSQKNNMSKEVISIIDTYLRVKSSSSHSMISAILVGSTVRHR